MKIIVRKVGLEYELIDKEGMPDKKDAIFSGTKKEIYNLLCRYVSQCYDQIEIINLEITISSKK